MNRSKKDGKHSKHEVNTNFFSCLPFNMPKIGRYSEKVNTVNTNYTKKGKCMIREKKADAIPARLPNAYIYKDAPFFVLLCLPNEN